MIADSQAGSETGGLDTAEIDNGIAAARNFGVDAKVRRRSGAYDLGTNAGIVRCQSVGGYIWQIFLYRHEKMVELAIVERIIYLFDPA